MSRKHWPLLIPIVLLMVIGGVFLFKKVTLIHIKNMDRLRAIHIRIRPPEPFSMFYIHSIYHQPVVEEFQAEENSIVLKGIRTKSPAVLEYYGFENMEEFHPMSQKLGAVLIIKRGMGEGQGLIVSDRKIYLSEIGERGDRIQLRVDSISLGKFLLLKWKGWISWERKKEPTTKK